MMLWVLIAIYLPHGTLEPELRHRAYETQQECSDAASAYTKGKLGGKAWAFCSKKKERVRAD